MVLLKDKLEFIIEKSLQVVMKLRNCQCQVLIVADIIRRYKEEDITKHVNAGQKTRVYSEDSKKETCAN